VHLIAGNTVRTALLSLAVLWGALVCMVPAAAQEPHPHPDARPSHPEARPPTTRPASPPPTATRSASPRPNERPAYDGNGQVLDSRYNHGRYYPPPGTAYRSLPPNYRPYYRGGERYYFNGGIWYAPRGPGFVVVRPPAGLMISVLPPYYSTIWVGGVPYYYADNVYYTWQPDQNGYAVVDPPDAIDESSPPPPDPGNPGATQAGPDLIIYPKNGQSRDQQAADEYECHNWARSQSGFDPTQTDGAAPSADADRGRNNYDRAMSACLQGRGYQVN
jgi:hypothetical protein